MERYRGDYARELKNFDYKYMRKDGSALWANVTANPILNEDGTLRAGLAMVTDITEKRAAQEAARESEARFHEMADNISEIFFLRTADEILYISPAYETVWGRPREDLYENPDAYIDSIHPEDRDRVLEAIRLERSEGKPFDKEYRIIRPDGQSRWVRARSYIIDNSDGNHRTAGVAEDITERKLAEQALRESEEKYRLLADSISDIVFNVDTNGNLQYASPSVERILGYEMRDLIGQSVNMVLAPDSAEVVSKLLEEIRLDPDSRRDDSIILELKISTSEGKDIWIEAVSRLVMSESGSLTGYIGVARDITKRKIAEDALRLSEERLQLSLAGSKDVLWDWEVDVGKMYLAPPWNEMLGYESGEVDWTLEILMEGVHPEDLPRQHEAMQSAVRGETDFTDEDFRFRNKEGDYIWVCCRGKVVERDENGIAKRISGTVGDITARVERERELKQSRDRLEEQARLLAVTNQELEAFAHTVSHDLRAPLRRICGWIALIMRDHQGSTDQEALQFLQMVEQNSRDMQQLVDVLLDFARMMRVELERTDVDLSGIARQILASLKSEISTTGPELRILETPLCNCDPHLMNIVIHNLLSNAVKYTSTGERVLIEFGAEQQDGKTVYYVRDNGVGFEQDKVDVLFVPFKRLHDDEEFKGLGIGLATVQRIIHRHGGRIWAEGEPGEGATFYFTIG